MARVVALALVYSLAMSPADASTPADTCAAAGTCQPRALGADMLQRAQTADVRGKFERLHEDDNVEYASMSDVEDGATRNLGLKKGNATLDIYGELLLSTAFVLANLSNYTGLYMSKDNNARSNTIRHQFGLDAAADLGLLYEKVRGFYDVLHKLLQTDATKLCPTNDFSNIMRCIGIAECALQKAVPAPVSIETYTLLVELVQRFETISWPLLEEALDTSGAVRVVGEVMIPPAWTCDQMDNGDDSGMPSLLEQDIEDARSVALANALSTLRAMERAAKLTHKAFDDHLPNSSMVATHAVVSEAWYEFCKQVACDHTNLWDIYGASHAHTSALIEAGVSISHLRNHIKNRMLLELRVQHFLGAHGETFAKRAYRDDAGAVHQQMLSYFTNGRTALRRDSMKFFSSLGGDMTKVFGLIDQDRFSLYLAQRRIGGIHENGVTQEDGMEIPALVQSGAGAGAAGTGPQWDMLLGDKNGCVNCIAGPLVDYFVNELACFGKVKSLGSIGYGKKFPQPTSVFGVGASFGANVGTDLRKLLDGQFAPSISLWASLVVGACPGSAVTGGVRVGVGVGGSLTCTPTTCSVKVAVGSVLSGLYPTGSPECVFGTALGPFRCMASHGVAVSVLCCDFDLTTGENGCR